MTITGVIVIFAATWFITLYILLPLGMKSQAEDGEVAPGTPASAPARFKIKRTVTRTTLIAIPIWIVLMAIIEFGLITLDDVDFLSGIEPASWQTAPANGN